MTRLNSLPARSPARSWLALYARLPTRTPVSPRSRATRRPASSRYADTSWQVMARRSLMPAYPKLRSRMASRCAIAFTAAPVSQLVLHSTKVRKSGRPAGHPVAPRPLPPPPPLLPPVAPPAAAGGASAPPAAAAAAARSLRVGARKVMDTVRGAGAAAAAPPPTTAVGSQSMDGDRARMASYSVRRAALSAGDCSSRVCGRSTGSATSAAAGASSAGVTRVAVYGTRCSVDMRTALSAGVSSVATAANASAGSMAARGGFSTQGVASFHAVCTVPLASVRCTTTPARVTSLTQKSVYRDLSAPWNPVPGVRYSVMPTEASDGSAGCHAASPVVSAVGAAASVGAASELPPPPLLL